MSSQSTTTGSKPQANNDARRLERDTPPAPAAPKTFAEVTQEYLDFKRGKGKRSRPSREGEALEAFRFHDLRHTFASHFMMSTGDLPALQKILGHATLAQTMRYAHLAKGHLRKATDALTFSTSSAHDAKIQADRRVNPDAPVAQVDRAAVS